VYVLGRNFPEHLKLVLGEEGDASIYQTIECDAERPDIDLLGHLGLLLLIDVGIAKLRGKEGRCADSLGELEVVVEVLSFRFRHGLVQLAIADGAAEVGHTKVGDLDAVIPAPEQIGGLDVAVHDSLVVQILQTQDCVPECRARLVQREAGHEGEVLGKGIMRAGVPVHRGHVGDDGVCHTGRSPSEGSLFSVAVDCGTGVSISSGQSTFSSSSVGAKAIDVMDSEREGAKDDRRDPGGDECPSVTAKSSREGMRDQ